MEVLGGYISAVLGAIWDFIWAVFIAALVIAGIYDAINHITGKSSW